MHLVGDSLKRIVGVWDRDARSPAERVLREGAMGGLKVSGE
jgi:hypothetical protein